MKTLKKLGLVLALVLNAQAGDYTDALGTRWHDSDYFQGTDSNGHNGHDWTDPGGYYPGSDSKGTRQAGGFD
jgi:hypothetical protein